MGRGYLHRTGSHRPPAILGANSLYHLDMLIRPATSSDVPHVLSMVAKTCALHERWDPAKYGFLPEPARMYERWLASRSKDPHSVFLVAEREAQADDPARLVGFIVGTTEPEIGIYRLQEYGFFQDLWVEPESRHEGIARQLVSRAIERFRGIGVEQIRLDVAARNEPARHLFESCGFRIATHEMLMELRPQAR